MGRKIMELVKQFTNDKGRVFNAVVTEDKNYMGGLVVSFYDAQYADKYKELDKKYPGSFGSQVKYGQFTGGRYYISTLLGTDGCGESIRGRGLCFDGGNADVWYLDSEAATQADLWLSEIKENRDRAKMFKEDDNKVKLFAEQLRSELEGEK